MCIVYTARIHTPGRGLVLDTTVKSGSGLGTILAPTWEIVMGVKQGRISEAAYTQRYLGILRERFATNRQPFLDILTHEQVTLKCYCRKGAFCHRHLALEVLEKIAVPYGIRFERGGEVE